MWSPWHYINWLPSPRFECMAAWLELTGILNELRQKYQQKRPTLQGCACCKKNIFWDTGALAMVTYVQWISRRGAFGDFKSRCRIFTCRRFNKGWVITSSPTHSLVKWCFFCSLNTLYKGRPDTFRQEGYGQTISHDISCARKKATKSPVESRARGASMPPQLAACHLSARVLQKTPWVRTTMANYGTSNTNFSNHSFKMFQVLNIEILCSSHNFFQVLNSFGSPTSPTKVTSQKPLGHPDPSGDTHGQDLCGCRRQSWLLFYASGCIFPHFHGGKPWHMYIYIYTVFVWKNFGTVKLCVFSQPLQILTCPSSRWSSHPEMIKLNLFKQFRMGFVMCPSCFILHIVFDMDIFRCCFSIFQLLFQSVFLANNACDSWRSCDSTPRSIHSVTSSKVRSAPGFVLWHQKQLKFGSQKTENSWKVWDNAILITKKQQKKT